MTKLKEPDNLAMLKHRLARTIEMKVAYNTFLQREVKVGDNNVCMNDEVVFQTTHTLLVAYYSFIYSLFDPSAVNFTKITESMLNHLPEKAVYVRNIALSEWEKIKRDISIIRNNIGFHHSPKVNGKNLGYSSYGEIHPASTELIMHSLMLFFRYAEDVYESHEPYGVKPSESDNAALLKIVEWLKGEIEKNPRNKLIEAIKSVQEKP